MTIAPTITTAQLILRHHVMTDFEPLYALLESDRAQFLGAPLSRKQSWHWIASEIGRILLAHTEGKGYARQGATAILNWVRRSLKPNTLVSYIDQKNLRSIALAERLGALPNPNAARPDGEAKEDTIVYRHALELVQWA